MQLWYSMICYIQVRSNVTSGKVFERAEEVSCGGNALRFYAGVRMRIIRNRLIKEEDKVHSSVINIMECVLWFIQVSVY